MTDELEFETTDRGFKHLAPIPTRYGHEVRVYESSTAFTSCLWINTKLAEKTPGGLDPEETTALLTVAQAEDLIKHLRWAIDNHYHHEYHGEIVDEDDEEERG